MENILGFKRSAKVMKINGETFKLKTPVRAGYILENHEGHVLLDSEAVMHYGVRAKPLEPQQELKPRRLYFLVEMPKFPSNQSVRSGVQMSAEERLESLMLARRPASALAMMEPEEKKVIISENNGGGFRVKMRLPKAEVKRLMAESEDAVEAAEKMIRLCMHGVAAVEENGDHGVVKLGPKLREKRVGFLPINKGDI